jgi:nucleoside phosphorylase
MTQSANVSCDVIILTALPVECKAVLHHLQDSREIVHPSGTIYYQGSFAGVHRAWWVAVAEIGRGDITAATETEKAINFFHAKVAIFVGIAGGIKDVKRGDVVAATKIYDYESGKAGQHFEPRPELEYASHALVQRARAEAKNEEWLARREGDRPERAPQVHIGPLAAGKKVLASTQSNEVRLINETYGDTLAIEMEGDGFLHPIGVNQTVYGLVIRGISDLIDDKAEADASGAQLVAAQHAAAFAFQVLAKFALPLSPTQTGRTRKLIDDRLWGLPSMPSRHPRGSAIFTSVLAVLFFLGGLALCVGGFASTSSDTSQPLVLSGIGILVPDVVLLVFILSAKAKTEGFSKWPSTASGTLEYRIVRYTGPILVCTILILFALVRLLKQLSDHS